MLNNSDGAQFLRDRVIDLLHGGVLLEIPDHLIVVLNLRLDWLKHVHLQVISQGFLEVVMHERVNNWMGFELLFNLAKGVAVSIDNHVFHSIQGGV